MCSSRNWLIILVFLSFFLVSCSYPVQIIHKSSSIRTNKKPDTTQKEPVQIASVLPINCSENTSINNTETEKTDSEEQRKKQRQECMDEALEILNQSQNLWEEGELESALSLLDEAYSVLIEVNGDPDVSWPKDDLRFMIAKRIIEIYTSRSSVATGCQSEIPFVMNADIKKEIKRFTCSQRKYFLRSYKRSGMYRSIILKELKEAGLPEELLWLPLVESGFTINALSNARALGLWQFIPSTGYKYGLKRDHYIDERMDVEKSTKAAIAYLKQLHGIFGDWLTVLAAYNCGEGRVLRVISRQHMNYLDNFWDLYRQLPCETAQYVPRFLAVVHIMKNPHKYGIDLDKLETDNPIPYEVVKVNKRIHLGDIAGKLNVPKSILISLNSELRYKVTPEGEYELKVPSGMGTKFSLMVDKIHTAQRPGAPEFVRHKIRNGEALSTIAKKYKSSVKSIMAANHLTSIHKIRAGKTLKIPVLGYANYRYTTYGHKKTKSEESRIPVKYSIKKGDSLWKLARRFNTTVSEIKRVNSLADNRLSLGQVITIGGDSPEAASKIYTIRKGDSLYLISRKNNVRLKELMEINNLGSTSKIYPGQTLIVKK